MLARYSMVAKTSQTSKEFIDYRFNEMDKKLTRIEQKMDNFTYAKDTDLQKVALVTENVDNRLTILEQKMKPIEKIYYLISGALATGIVGTAFYVLQRMISK